MDLYVRCANSIAIGMYEGMDYSVYRRVREYYGNLGVGKGGRDDEDAFGASSVLVNIFLFIIHEDMRKALSRDVSRKSVRANGRDIIVSAHDVS